MLVGSVTQPITPETPDWLKGTIETNQRRADIQFAEQRARWLTQVAEWIDNQTRNREAGRPYETTFTIPKPQRVVFFDTGAYYADEGRVADLTLGDPTLPPPAPIVPIGVPTEGGAARDAAMFRQLAKVQSDINAIKAHFNIP